jgi:hypothetical protein
MLYYKYRPANEMNFKELMYDELYFSSSTECNDPFDSKTYFEFTNQTGKWKALLLLAWRNSEILNVIDVDMVAQALANNAPLAFESALADDFQEFLLTAIANGTKSKVQSVEPILEATQRIRELLHLYKMPTSYFASFSRCRDEPLMWSHYSARHEGYCLIFKSIDGKLNQCPRRIKNGVRRETPGGLAPSMSHGIPAAFVFRDVEYVAEVRPLNAFDCFPEAVAGKIQSDEDRLKLRSKQVEQYLHKHKSWSYEKESRLTLSQPTPWLFGAHFDYTAHERLLHYEPTQLVGIIFGARISESNKSRLIEIIKERVDRIAKSADYDRIIFDFMVFEAALANNARELKIHPTAIYGLSKTLNKNEQDFSRRYNDWEKGFGLHFSGNSYSKVFISS